MSEIWAAMKLDFVLIELIYLTNDFWLKYNSLVEVIDRPRLRM